MLNCAICNTTSPDGTATCGACGEASWHPSSAPVVAAPKVEPVAAAIEPEPAPVIAAPPSRRGQKSGS